MAYGIYRGECRQVFDPRFQAPEHYAAHLSRYPSIKAVIDSHLEPHRKIQDIAIRCWTARPVSAGMAYMLSFDSETVSQAKATYEQLNARTSSHLIKHRDTDTVGILGKAFRLTLSPVGSAGYRGGRTAAASYDGSIPIEFLVGYPELLCHWVIKNGRQYLFMKWEDAQVTDPHHTLSLINSLAPKSLQSKTLTPLDMLYRMHPTWLAATRKERVSPEWKKLCQHLFLTGNKMTPSALIQRITWLMSVFTNDTQFPEYFRQMTAREMYDQVRTWRTAYAGQARVNSGRGFFSTFISGRTQGEEAIWKALQGNIKGLSDEDKSFGIAKLQNWLRKIGPELKDQIEDFEDDCRIIADVEAAGSTGGTSAEHASELFFEDRIGQEVRLSEFVVDRHCTNFCDWIGSGFPPKPDLGPDLGDQMHY